jgi:hypothetical protein
LHVDWVKNKDLEMFKSWIEIIFHYFIVCVYKLTYFYMVHVPMTFPK